TFIDKMLMYQSKMLETGCNKPLITKNSLYPIVISLYHTNDRLQYLKYNNMLFTWRIQVKWNVLEQLWLTNLPMRSEEHTSELQSRFDLVCRVIDHVSFPTRRSSDLVSKQDVRNWLQQAVDNQKQSLSDSNFSISHERQTSISKIEQYVIHLENSGKVERVGTTLVDKFAD